MRMLAGTSGYSYKEWVGPFYPEKTPAPEMLRFYARHFSTVEINNTFYRMPAAALLERWAQEVPDGFAFAVKAPRRITHIRRLKDAGEIVEEFLRRAASLGDKLGIVLYQCPPTLRKDLPRLRDFLATLPAGARAAFEFRHDSWHDDEVYDSLRERGASWCVAEEDDGATPFVCTAPDAYLRLRRTNYTEADLRVWAERLAAQPLERAWVYFKHEDEALAPKFASLFTDLWSGNPAPKTKGATKAKGRKRA
ncbi:MAG TPA: DUF72 domain-containing protein [Verrucomicrobiae bacterium]|nr:DUF72 domain-containing protein [Verrucomicrobiae bacterium]